VKEGSNSWETTVLQSFKPVSPIFFKMFPAILQDFSQDLSQDLSPRFIPGIFPRISPLSLQFPTSFENEALLPQRLCCLPSEFSLQRGWCLRLSEVWQEDAENVTRRFAQLVDEAWGC
jgi:hypothetical protein